MANYIGTINVPTRYVYKNSTAWNQNTPSYNSRWDNVQIHIPNPSLILSQFGEPWYFRNDTNHIHPFYLLHTDADHPFDFNDANISFILPYNRDGKVGFAEDMPKINKTNDTVTREEIDGDMYGTVNRSSSNIGTGYLSQGSYHYRNGGGSFTQGLRPNSIDYIKSISSNADGVIGLINTYNPSKDAYLCQDISNVFLLMYKDYQGTGSIEGAYMMDNSNNRTLTYTGAEHNSVADDFTTYYYSPGYTIRAKNSSHSYTNQSVTLACVDALNYWFYGEPDPFTQHFLDVRSGGIYAFLFDGTDVWILMCGDVYHAPQDTGSYLLENTGAYLNWTLIKVKDLPTYWNSGSIVTDHVYPANGTWISDSILMNDTFRELLNIEDAPGPGPEPEPGDFSDPDDPLGDLITTDMSGPQGGNHDTTIEADTAADDSPNLSYDRFVSSSSFFGSYLVSKQDLINYTDTLTVLYEHSSDPLFGSAPAEMADRLVSGVTSIVMLPYDVTKFVPYDPAHPSDPYDYMDNVTFAIGGTGVKAQGASYLSYAAGNAWATSKLLNTVTKEWTVDLGTIPHFYDNFLDFAPFSRASLFIPYVGQFELPINLIQSGVDGNSDMLLRLKMRLNIVNGDVLAIFEAYDSTDKYNLKSAGYIPYGQWSGNCARAIRVSVNDNSAAIKEGVRAITSLVSFAASGGATGANGLTSSYGDSSSANSANSVGSSSGMNYSEGNSKYDGVAHMSESFSESAGYQESSSSGTSQSTNMSDNWHSSKGENYHGSVSFSGNPSSVMPSSISSGQHLIGGSTTAGEIGWMGTQEIQLKVERPILWKWADYGDLIGYPTKKYGTLSSIQGYASIPRIHLNCSCTLDEKVEIERLLAEGVIF